MSDNNEDKTEDTAEEMEKKTQPVKKKGGLIKIIIVVAIIAAVVIVSYLTGLVDYLQLENVRAMQEWIEGFGFLGYIIFVVLYVVAAVFMLPASVLTIIAGVAFGSVLGSILALVAATIGATIAFIVARYVARETIVNRFHDNPLFNKIDNGLRENGVSFLILTRLVPIFPYNVQNYIYGLTPIKLPTYSLVSFITMMPGAVIYAYMAGQIVEEGFTLWLMIQFAIAGVVLFLVSLIPKYIAKKKGIKIKD